MLPSSRKHRFANYLYDSFCFAGVFEDSRITGRPVNFTCGRNKFSIRFGYFNDVSTKHSDGFLDPNVVYFDFAVIPYRKPFAFCSYTTRRTDGRKPLKYAPFPSQDVWDHVSSLEERSSETDEGLVDKSLDSTPENEEPSMEPPAHPTPDLVPTIAPDVARQRLVPDPFSS